MSLRVCAMRTSRFSALAAIFRRTMVCSSLVSLWSSCCSAACRSSSGRPASLIFCVSCNRHASSSLYRISKSAVVRGRMRLSISRRRLSSASCCLCAASSARNACRSSRFSRSSLARWRALHPRVYLWMTMVFLTRSWWCSSEVMYLPATISRSMLSSSSRSGRAICVLPSRTACWERVFCSHVCVSRVNCLSFSYTLGLRSVWHVACRKWLPVFLLRYPPSQVI
mmetsp:Transcript_48964/g.93570  ORF Transcript_48964/g.93570 Transcript_48964/m.93570 type:complete len:225 (-) Transcript_48964:895-1569(-)